MQRICLLSVFLILSASFFSCQKGNGKTFIPPSSKNLIIGKWTLHQQHSVEYIDGLKSSDTVINASPTNYADLQVNSNGTYTTSGMYTTSGDGNLSSAGSVVSYSTTGGCSFVGANFTIAGILSGFDNGASFYGTFSTAVPVITPISHAVQIIEVTTTNLTLHTENIYTYTINNISQTYKIESDLSYTR